MTKFNTFPITATGSVTGRSTAQRFAEVINVKDFGAKGDGIANDGNAIQRAFDAAYGIGAAPNGPVWRLNKAVVFPAGLYLVDQQIFINEAQGACLLGAGQGATRLKYTGPASNLPNGDLTSLLTCRTMTYSNVDGITFDVTSSNASVAVQLANFAKIQNDGTGNMWTDCGFVGGSDDGLLCTLDGSGQLGSEELFVGCTFENCTHGLLIASGNALDYALISCSFKNCVRGIFCPNGSINLIQGCSFDNPSFASFTGTMSGTTLTVNSGLVGAVAKGQMVLVPGAAGVNVGSEVKILQQLSGSTWQIDRPTGVGPVPMITSALDIFVKQNQTLAIIGCRSTSPNFCLASPVSIDSCYHNPANTGHLYLGGVDDEPAHGVIDGCLAGSNSGIWANYSTLVYLRGNVFNNGSYLNDYIPLTFTGQISGASLRTTSFPNLVVNGVGMFITGAGVTPGTRVISGSGNSFVVSPSQTVGSTTMSTTFPENI